MITPACGFVNCTGAVIIGVLAGGIPYVTVSLLKPALKYDDALDTFGVHAVGGTLGALVTGILATKEVNSNLKDDLLATLFRSQLSAIAVTLVLSTLRHSGHRPDSKGSHGSASKSGRREHWSGSLRSW